MPVGDKPAPDLDIADALVRRLLADQHPDLADRPLEPSWPRVGQRPLSAGRRPDRARAPAGDGGPASSSTSSGGCRTWPPALPVPVPVPCGWAGRRRVPVVVDHLPVDRRRPPRQRHDSTATPWPATLAACLRALHRPAPPTPPQPLPRHRRWLTGSRSTRSVITLLARRDRRARNPGLLRRRWSRCRRGTVHRSDPRRPAPGQPGGPRWPTGRRDRLRRLTAGDPAVDLSIAWRLLPDEGARRRACARPRAWSTTTPGRGPGVGVGPVDGALTVRRVAPD